MAATALALSIDSHPIESRECDASVDRLRELVRGLSFGRKNVMLSSGQPSTFYFDMKPSMLDPEGASIIADLIFRQALAVKADFVGGLEMGAVPITGAISLHSYHAKAPIGGFFVRKEAKKHGEKKRVEGLGPGVSLKDKRVVIVDDVTTTGKSALQVVKALREEGAVIVLAISIVDREEGASANFAEEGIELKSLLQASEFL